VGGHKRTETVLFTDVVGSTDMMSSVSQAEADVLRTRHFAGIRSALAVHRGREVKTLGDGFMATFESATDGVGCAVTMHRAVARENQGRDRKLMIRVGISIGEVTDENGDAFGIPVVEASRLCDSAGPGQILASELVRLMVGSGGVHHLEQKGTMALKGLPEPVSTCEVVWDAEEDFALRVALADDSALLRQGIASVLEADGIDVVLQADDAESLLERLPAVKPDVVVVDVRMPPTHTTEGLDAAERIRAEHPETGVLVLSAELQATAARRLLDGGTEGIGYLLKDRVGEVGELLGAIRTVASGGSAIDAEIVDRLAAAA
jgi:class 3 adenylate cyclase/ActR/RegA family two-component response regulator